MAYLLALTFGGLVAVAVAGVLIFAVATNFKNTTTLLDDKATMTMQALKFGLRVHLEPSRRAVDTLAKLYRDSETSITDETALNTAMVGVLVSRPDVEAVLIYDHNLVRSGVYHDPEGKIGVLDPLAVSSRDIYDNLKSIRVDDGTNWAKLLYIPSAKRVFASVVAPLERNGIIDGYLIAAISTARLSEILAELVAEDGTAFILNAEGNLIAHSNAKVIGLEELRTHTEPAVSPVKAGDMILARRAEWMPIDLISDENWSSVGFPKAARAGISMSELELEDSKERFGGGPPAIIMNADIEGFGPKPWTIGIYFSGRDIGQEFMRVWGSMVIGFVALIVAVVIAVWLARRIARPLGRLSVQASRIATLDIEDVDDLPRSRVREIDTTANAFNAMLEGLRAFTIYVPRSLVAKLVQTGMDETAKSREARLTMMFSDIVGFTTLSESLSAQETADLLNRHFQILVSCVEAEGGTVDKFLGDGMLAFWGAPDKLEDHAAAAVRAAQAIARAVTADNAEAVKRGAPAIRLRIGIHTGRVIVGNIGTFDRVNYTIVGDNVNVCQRIEALGKDIAPGDEICVLASADTISAISCPPTRKQVGEHHLRGRAAPVELWRIDSSVENDAAMAESPESVKDDLEVS